MNDLFNYDPERETKLNKLKDAAREIYARCTDGRVWQPTYTSLERLLNKIYLYLTFDCPLRCGFCFAEGGERKCATLEPGKIADITAQAAEAGFGSAVFTGGEPLVYKGFDELIGLLAGLDIRGMQLSLRSSFGFDIPEERLKALCAVFDKITVSIDGNEQSHDAVRGAGRYKKTLYNLRRALDIGGAEPAVNAVLTREQFKGKEGASLIKLTDDLGIKDLTVTSPFPLGRGRELNEPHYKWVKGRGDIEVPTMRFRCGLGSNLYMQPDGRAYPCYAWCEPNQMLGDLSKESLKTVLDRGDLLRLANTGVDTNKKCRNCEVRYFCGGRCKIFVSDKQDVNSGDFDCTSQKHHILSMLKRGGILPEDKDVL